MNRIKFVLAISAFSMVVLALPAVASAQWGGRNRDDDYYGRNGNYNRNIRGTVQRLKNRAKNFEKMTDRAEDRDDDRWGNRNRGWNNGDLGRLEDLADRFRNATDDLEDDYGNGRNLNNSRDEARRVLDIGSQIDQELYRSRNRQLANQWNMIRRDLDVIASVYGYGGNYNNRYPGNNRNRNGDWRNRVPFPLPF